MWSVCLILAILVFVLGNLAGYGIFKRKRKRQKLLSMVPVVLALTFLSLIILMIPVSVQETEGWLRNLQNSIQSTMLVFSLNGEFSSFLEGSEICPDTFRALYQLFAGCLYILAPVLLVGVVISFFKNLFGYLELYLVRNRKLYIFSELNDRSLMLARSCQEHDLAERKKCLLVFTDVFDENAEESFEQMEQAKQLGAIVFKDDILSLHRKLKKKNCEMCFFVLGQNDTENLDHTLGLMEQYREEKNVGIYSFMDSCEAELMISSSMRHTPGPKVRRICEVQSAVYNYLYETNLFEQAYVLPDGSRVLKMVLLGLGTYGTELLRALCWYGQMPGFRLEIHVFDRDVCAREKLEAQCPELLKLNHNSTPGECHYDIWFHDDYGQNGVDVETGAFIRILQQIQNITHVYVMLGEDEKNIRMATQMRMLLRRQKTFAAQIFTILSNMRKSGILEMESLCNFKEQDYEIKTFGGIRRQYTYDRVVESELEVQARRRHLHWSDVENIERDTLQFYQYEYCWKSSQASTIRSRMRYLMHIPGTEKPAEQRSEEEKARIQEVEHAGWNAYMRAEGYCFAPERDDLAKQHHLLIPFHDLPEKEKIKDDVEWIDLNER